MIVLTRTYFSQENPAEEDAVVVEKILGSRMRTKDADVCTIVNERE